MPNQISKNSDEATDDSETDEDLEKDQETKEDNEDPKSNKPINNVEIENLNPIPLDNAQKS